MIDDIYLDFEIMENDLYPCVGYTPAELEVKMKLFLKAYSKYGVISKAASVAGVKRSTVDSWIKNIEKFEKLFKEIDEVFNDTLELEANKRAKEKSDTLLQFLLKARRPERFNPVQHVSANVETKGIKLVFSESELSPKEKNLLKEKLNGEDEE